MKKAVGAIECSEIDTLPDNLTEDQQWKKYIILLTPLGLSRA
jgi:hypothetical protein